jgi:hypothetical protein
MGAAAVTDSRMAYANKGRSEERPLLRVSLSTIKPVLLATGCAGVVPVAVAGRDAPVACDGGGLLQPHGPSDPEVLLAR